MDHTLYRAGRWLTPQGGHRDAAHRGCAALQLRRADRDRGGGDARAAALGQYQ